jgi:hypothetical protein
MRKVTAALLLLMLAAPSAHAQNWNLEIKAWESGGFRGVPAGEGDNIQRGELTLAYRWDTEDGYYRQPSLRYVHQPLLVRTGDPPHNGYLHQLDWRREVRWRQLGGEITAGVHGVSNMFKHGDFHRHSLVLSGATWYHLNREGARAGLHISRKHSLQYEAILIAA